MQRLRVPIVKAIGEASSRLPADDPTIRTTLKRDLEETFADEPETLIVEEMGLGHGATRVDVAVVNGHLHGFEVKSDRDTLRRLPRQAHIYNKVLDYATLVLGPHHVEPGMRLVPDWWGIKLVEKLADGSVRLADVRVPRLNQSVDGLSVAKLLWRHEALRVLEELGALSGFRSKTRLLLYARLVEAVSLNWLRARVRQQLRARLNWRPLARPASYGGLGQL